MSNNVDEDDGAILGYDDEGTSVSQKAYITEPKLRNPNALRSTDLNSPMHPSMQQPILPTFKPKEEVLFQAAKKDMKCMIIEVVKDEFNARCDSNSVEMIFGSLIYEIQKCLIESKVDASNISRLQILEAMQAVRTNIQANEKLPHAHKLRSFSEYEEKYSPKQYNGIKASALDCNNYWNKVKNNEENKKQKLELLTFEREEQMKSMMTDRPYISKNSKVMASKLSNMGMDRLYNAYTCIKPHFSPVCTTKHCHHNTAYKLYMKPVEKHATNECVNHNFTLSPNNRMLAKDKLLRSFTKMVGDKANISYQLFYQILVELSLIDKATNENIVLKLWAELNPSKKKEISKEAMLNFVYKLLSLEHSKGNEENIIRKEYATLLSCYLKKDIGKTRNAVSKAFSFCPQISKKSHGLAQFQKNKQAFASYIDGCVCSPKQYHKQKMLSKAVQPFQARGDSPSIPKKKCKFKASVSTIGEFKNILKVVDYTGPYSEGKRKAMLHKYLISLQ